jgi:hypothetical protein
MPCLCERKDRSVCCQLGDRSICFEIVSAVGPREPPGDEASLQPGDVAIGIMFGLKNPFASDQVFAGGQIGEFPCAVLPQGIVFFLNRCPPFIVV